MNTRTSTAALIFVCLLCAPIVYSETLQEAIQQAIRTHPEMTVQEKGYLASEQGIAQARGGYFPRVDVTAGYGRERSESASTGFETVSLWRREAGWTVRQMLFDGFSTASDLRRSKAKAKADAFRVWGISEDIGLAVTDIYLNVLRTREVVAAATKNVAAHEHVYKMVQKLTKSGLGNGADNSQALSRLELAHANLLSAQSTARDAVTQYTRIIGSAPQDPLVEPVSPGRFDLPHDPEEALSLAVLNHPVLKSAEQDIQEAEAQHAISLSLNYPRVDAVLNGNVNRDLNGTKGKDKDISFMLQAQYNLFHGGVDRAKQRETAALLEQAMAIRDRSKRQAVEKMGLSWNAFSIAKERLVYLANHRDAADRTLAAYKQQFKFGKRTLLDLLNTENEVFIAHNNYTNGYYDLIDAKYRILNAQGKLLAFTRTELPPMAVAVRDAH